MITIHVYCSYKLSPVGFQYGALQYPPDSVGDYLPLSQPPETPSARFVKTAFDYGFIAEVRGKLPASNSYVFLVKRYRYSYPEGHPDVGKDVYVNMAFEFDDVDQYKRFVRSFVAALKNDEADLKRKRNDAESELIRKMRGDSRLAEKLKQPDKFQEALETAQYDLTWKMAFKGKMADLIHPDYAADDYALTIDRRKLTEFMESMLDGQPEKESKPVTKTQFLVPSVQTKYREELSQLFGFGQPSDFREKSAGAILVYGADGGPSDADKKKLPRPLRQRPLPLLILVLLILIALLGAFLLGGRNKDLNQNAAIQEKTQLPALPERTPTQFHQETQSVREESKAIARKSENASIPPWRLTRIIRLSRLTAAFSYADS